MIGTGLSGRNLAKRRVYDIENWQCSMNASDLSLAVRADSSREGALGAHGANSGR